MDKAEVLRIVRANDEKFKLHLEKLRRLEEKEKRINAKEIKGDKGLARFNVVPKENREGNYVYDQLFNSIENEEEGEVGVRHKGKEEKGDKAMMISNEEYGKLWLEKEKDLINVKNKESSDLSHKLKAVIKEENKKAEDVHQINKDQLKDKAKPHSSNSSPLEKLQANEDSLAKVKEHYANTESSNSHSAHNSIHQDTNVQKANNQEESNKTKTLPIKPTHLKNLQENVPIKSRVLEAINAAVNENESKRPYTAYTYSTIQKIKTTSKAPKKPGVFEKVMKKKYKGKTDKVALYQMHQSDWSKKASQKNRHSP